MAQDHYNCFYCEQTFSMPNSLRYHLDYVHPWNASFGGDSKTNNKDVSSTEKMDNKNQKDIVNIRNIMKLCMEQKTKQLTECEEGICTKDVRVKKKEDLIEKMEEKREEKKEKKTVMVNIMNQCLEESEEFSRARKHLEDLEVKETE